mgnify:FL=1
MAIEPIMLTEFGDFLRPEYEKDFTDEMTLSIGIKWHCNSCSAIDIIDTKTHCRLVCRNYGTIVIIPQNVKKYDQ